MLRLDSIAGPLAAAALLNASVAAADMPIAPAVGADETPSAPARPPAPSGETRWYGYQPLVVDTGALLLAFGVPPVGLVMYAVGAPAIHAVHGRGDAALGSFALRVVAPVSLGLVGYYSASCEPDADTWCRLTGVIVGAGIGAVAAVVVDDVFIAREPVGMAPTSKPTVSIAPSWTPHGGGIVGVISF